MIIPVRCFNCGKLLADKWDFYQSELRKAKGSAYGEPTIFDGKTLPKTEEGKLFDKLELTRYCCRKALLTHVDMIEKV